MKCRLSFASVLTLGLALISAAMAPSLAHAQRPEGGRGFGGGMAGDLLWLAGQKSVQDELKATPEQAEQVKLLVEKRREGGGGGGRDLSREERQKRSAERTAANTEALGKVLGPEQIGRLKQISLQQQGAWAFDSPGVADKLQLTSAQQDQVKSIREAAGQQMREAFQEGNREANRDKFTEMRKTTADKLMAVLTDDQKSKWKELTGETFAGQIERPNFGGGQGRRRGDN